MNFDAKTIHMWNILDSNNRVCNDNEKDPHWQLVIVCVNYEEKYQQFRQCFLVKMHDRPGQESLYAVVMT